MHKLDALFSPRFAGAPTALAVGGKSVRDWKKVVSVCPGSSLPSSPGPSSLSPLSLSPTERNPSLSTVTEQSCAHRSHMALVSEVSPPRGQNRIYQRAFTRASKYVCFGESQAEAKTAFKGSFTPKRVEVSCCCGNLNDQLNRVFHEKPAISSHHQSGCLALGRLDDRDNALDEVFRIVLVLLEHRHPLPQTAGTGLLVRVRLGLHCGYFHHFRSPTRSRGGQKCYTVLLLQAELGISLEPLQSSHLTLFYSRHKQSAELTATGNHESEDDTRAQFRAKTKVAKTKVTGDEEEVLQTELEKLDSLRSKVEQSADAFIRARKELEEILVFVSEASRLLTANGIALHFLCV
ncbi:hypothetical protein INR49_024020 [Caranx melampygus]|nr:hypothetical protein INR49_024020 [Caranx melampygus]